MYGLLQVTGQCHEGITMAGSFSRFCMYELNDNTTPARDFYNV